jgi:4a-hydroxytetrahydrobiopterin dehydratase
VWSPEQEAGVALLEDGRIDAALEGLAGWARRGKAIEKRFTFPSFPDAMAFLLRLAFDAEAADHHPDVAIHYREVTLSYWTHSEGGITQKDLDGAATAERCARGHTEA